MESTPEQRSILAIATAGAAFLLVILIIPNYLYHIFVHPELHVLIGVVGAVIAGLSGFLIVRQDSKINHGLTCTGVALLGSALLDLFHTLAPSSLGIASLHSLSLALGGTGLALVWSETANTWARKHIRTSALMVIIAVGAISLTAALLGGWGSSPEDQTNATQTATRLSGIFNIFACMGYFAAFVFFVKAHFDPERENQLIMALVAMLMCAASIGFSNGESWSSDWWGSHVFRGMGYLLILLYIIETHRNWTDHVDSEHKRLLTILDGIDDMIYIADPETHELLFANSKLKEAFGRDLEGKKCFEALQGNTSPCDFCTNNQIFGQNEGKTHVWEAKNKRNNRWYRCSDKAITWTDGRSARLEMATDITEQKKNQIALEENEERLRQIAETLDAVFWLYDTVEREMLYLSPAFETIFGHKPSKGDATPFHWIEHILEEDRNSVQQALEDHETQGYNLEYRIAGSDERVRTIHDRGFPIHDSDGKCVRLAGIAQDVTELRHTEAALKQSRDNFRLALDSANAGVFFYDFKADELKWDARSLEIYGITEDEFSGNLEGWEDRLHREDSELAISTFLAALKAKKKRLPLRYRIVRPDLEVRHVLGTMVISYDERNQPELITGLHFDETRQVEVDAELVAARRTAESASQAKSIFLANMSHEIRSPMNAIMGFLQLMQMEDQKPTQSHWLDLMWRASEHLLELINEVLDLSKIEAGMLSLRKAEFRLDKMLEETIALFRMRATKQGLTLHFLPAADLEESFYGDKGKLRQILINLLSNALKFTKEGRITVRAGRDDTHQTSQAEGKFQFYFEVRDTGIGLNPEDLKKVFDPFSQTDAGEAQTGGTGLGLTLSREYAQLMDGEIDVTSRIGAGSCFRVTFKLENPPEETSQVQENRPPLTRASHDDKLRTIRALVVDDDPFAIRMMSELLTRLNCEIVTVSSGEEALIKFNEGDFELIFLDIRMPGIGGEKTLLSLRKQIQNEIVRIVVVSAGLFEEDRQRLIEEGADEVLYKPIRINQITEQVHLARGL